VKFTDRKDWLYDPDVFKKSDTQTALKIHREFVSKHSANPRPKFFEVNREATQYDPLWHMPINPRTPIARELDVPAIVTFTKPVWRPTPVGSMPYRRDQFWLANLDLQEKDWFPIRGDYVYWNGYRYFIYEVIIPPEAYWHQTNVWMGLQLDCIIPPEGDAKPLVNPGEAAPAETTQTYYGL